MTRRDLASYVALVVIWGTTWAAIRVGLEGMPPMTSAALRFAVASLALLPFVWRLRLRLGTSSVERRLWLVNAAFTFLGSYGVVYWAEQHVPSALAAVLFATFPLFVAVFAHFGLPSERLGPARLLGVLLGFAGTVVLFSDDLAHGSATLVPALVFLLSPTCAAIGQVLVKRSGGGVHALSLTLVPMAISAGVFAVLALSFERGREVHLGPRSVASFLYLGVLGSAVAFYLYFQLLQRMDATRLSLLTYLCPLVAVVVGVVFLKERLTSAMVLGMLVILSGVGLASRSAAKG